MWHSRKPESTRKLYRISLPYATFGVIASCSGLIVESAEAGKWTRYKSIVEVSAQVKRRHGTMERVES